MIVTFVCVMVVLFFTGFNVCLCVYMVALHSRLSNVFQQESEQIVNMKKELERVLNKFIKDLEEVCGDDDDPGDWWRNEKE